MKPSPSNPDLSRFRPPIPWMLWAGNALLTAWAVCLLWSDTAINTTTLHGFKAFISARPLGIVMLVSAIAAAWPLLHRRRRPYDIWWLVPQQAVLLIASRSAIAAMIAAKFGDGVVRHHAFISADQVITVIVTLFALGAVVDRWTSDRRVTRALRAIDEG